MQIDKTYRRIRAFGPVTAVSAALILLGCGDSQSSMEEVQASSDSTAEMPAPVRPPQPDPEPLEIEPAMAEREQATAEGNYREDTVWAPGYTGKLIEGLNGGEYPPYEVSVIEQFQRFLFQEGLYDGPVTGIFDQPTRDAIAEFQRANGIVASGVPSPETREALAQTNTDAG